MTPEAYSSRRWRGLLDVFWTAPLLSVPFAGLFGTIFGRGAQGYFQAYRIALVFALCVSLAIWGMKHFPPFGRIVNSGEMNAGTAVRISLMYTGAALLGSYAGSFLVNAFVMPGFMGTTRNLLLIGMFTLIFSAVFIGFSYAITYHKEAVEAARSEGELRLARRVQESFLLTEIPKRPGFDMHAINISSREVSGDFYDWVSEGEGRSLIAIADVSGKGFPAALLSSMLQAALRTQAGAIPRVPEIMGNLNRLVHRSGNFEQFATFFLARLDERSGILSFTNAGHNLPVLFRRDGSRELLSDGGLIVGMMEEPSYDEGTVRLEPGDRLVLYTDGITEAQNRQGAFFDEDRLYDLVESLPPELTSAEIAERILAGVRRFLDGQEAGDDMTLFVLRATVRTV
jgi:hypothetical protein